MSNTQNEAQENAKQESATSSSEDKVETSPSEAGEATLDTSLDDIDALKTALEEAQAKADENMDIALRAKAETENIRKRAERDVQSAHKFALEKFIPDLLGVRDSLELGMNAAKEADTIEKFIEGSELTLKQLNDSLTKHGVVEVNPLGEKLDPELHQAVSMQPSEEHEAGTIITVIQKGFTLNERLIRPAMVIVAQ